MVLLSLAQKSVEKIDKFTHNVEFTEIVSQLTLFRQIFRESIVLIKEVTKDLISRIILWVKANSSLCSSTLCCAECHSAENR